MSEVKRYELDRDEENACACMLEYKNGDYVLYDDYKKLESQISELIDYTNSQDAKIKDLEQKNKNLQDAITKYIEGRKWI